jgi:hypothetical protein
MHELPALVFTVSVKGNPALANMPEQASAEVRLRRRGEWLHIAPDCEIKIAKPECEADDLKLHTPTGLLPGAQFRPEPPYSSRAKSSDKDISNSSHSLALESGGDLASY